MRRGYIKLWRKSLESQIFAHGELWKLWSLCLCLTNHKNGWVVIEGLAMPVKVEAGQFITGRISLHRAYYQLDIRRNRRQNRCPMTVWRWLLTLKNMRILNVKTYSRFSIVTICNWETYQTDENGNVQVNVQHVFTNKNDKNEEKKESLKKDSCANEDICTTDFTTFWQLYPNKKDKQAAQKRWTNLNPSRNLQNQILTALKKHKETKQWQRDGGRYIPLPSTWLFRRRWEDEIAPDLLADEGGYMENGKYVPRKYTEEERRKIREAGRNDDDDR